MCFIIKMLSENEIADLGIDANLRAENITLVEFAKLNEINTLPITLKSTEICCNRP